MDPLIGSALLKVGGSILGGIFGNKAAKKERKWAIQDQIDGPSRLREGAEKANFNPLSLLGSNMAGGFGQTGTGVPPLASTALLTGAVDDFGSVMSGEAQQNRKRNELETNLAQVRLDQALAGGAGGVSSKTSRLTSKAIPALAGAAILDKDGRVTDSAKAGMSSKTDPLIWPKIGAKHLPASPSKISGKHPYGPAPMLIEREDGFTSANQEIANDPETDFWAWFREGTVVENTDKLLSKNFGTFEDQPLGKLYKKTNKPIKKRLSRPFSLMP